MTLRDSFQRVAVGFTVGPVGFAFQWAIGLVLDAAHEKHKAGIKSRFPNVYTAESLGDIGNDRLIDRGPAEPPQNYADRLSAAFDTWRSAGNAITLLGNLAAYFSPSPVKLSLVDERGVWFERDPATGVITRTRPGVFPPPAVDSVTPASVTDAGGALVTISGSYYFGVTGASVCGYALLGVAASSDGLTITGTTPAGMTPQTGDVVVDALGGQGKKVNAFTVTAAIPSLTLSSLNVAQTDSAGGDSNLIATGTGVNTASAVQFSRDSGATWVAGTFGPVTGTPTTTRRLVPPPMAAATSAVGRVRLLDAGSNPTASLPIAFWAPTDEASFTYGAERGGYSSGTGVWTRRASLAGLTQNFVSSGPPYAAANAGAPTFNATKYLSLNHLTSDLMSTVAGAVACVYVPTDENNPEQADAVTYANKQIWSKQSSGPMGMWNATDGATRWFGFYLYDNGGVQYRISRRAVVGTMLGAAHSVVGMFKSGSWMRVAVDGSDPALASTPLTGQPFLYDNPVNLGADYTNAPQVNGEMRAWFTFNGEQDAAFVTRFNNWAIARGLLL